MRVKVEPYTIEQVHELIRDGLKRMEPWHRRWELSRFMRRFGKLPDGLVSMIRDGHIEADLDEVMDSVNYLLPHTNIIVASVVDRDPKFVVDPRHMAPSDEERHMAQMLLHVGEYFWDLKNCTEALRCFTEDTVNIGNGVLYVDWARYEEETVRDADEVEREVEDVIRVAREEAIATGAAGIPPFELLRAQVPDSVTEILENSPVVEYVDPRDLLVAADATRMERARWVARRVVRPVDEVRADERYTSARKKVTADSTYRNQRDRQQMNTYGIVDPEAVEFAAVTIWEFYDMRTRRYVCTQLGLDEPLYEGELEYAHQYSPFVHQACYRQRPEDFWGFGILENAVALQDLFNQLYTTQLDAVSRAGRKAVVIRGVLDDDSMSQLEDPTDESVIEVSVPEELVNFSNVQQLIGYLDRPPIPAEIPSMMGQVAGMMVDHLGLNSIQTGTADLRRTPATGVAVLDGNASLRTADIRAAVEKAATDVFKLIVLLSSEYLDGEDIGRIVGPQHAGMWQVMEDVDIAGEFRIKVQGGSTRAVNPATRQNRGLQSFSMVIPSLSALVQAGLADPQVLLKATREALRDLGYDPDDVVPATAPPPPAAPPGMGPGMPPGMGPGMPPGMSPGLPPGMPPGMPPEMAAMLGGMNPGGMPMPPLEGGEGMPPEMEGGY